MIGWLAELFIRRGISGRLGKAFAWGIAAAGALALLALGWTLLKGSIIKSHDAAQERDAAEEQLKNQGAADVADDRLEDRDQRQQQDVREAIDHAEDQDPNHGASSVGPVSDSAVEQLRKNRRPAR